MRLSSRLHKLEASVPRCDPGVIHFLRGEELAPAAEPCRACGECHDLVVREIIVTSRADIERVRALNAAEGRP